jgi:hypothetical protein
VSRLGRTCERVSHVTVGTDGPAWRVDASCPAAVATTANSAVTSAASRARSTGKAYAGRARVPFRPNRTSVLLGSVVGAVAVVRTGNESAAAVRQVKYVGALAVVLATAVALWQITAIDVPWFRDRDVPGGQSYACGV